MLPERNSQIALLGNTLLRIAIHRNLVSFPAQIPAFMKQPAGSTQQRVAQLYFVRGWSVRNICERYRLSKKLVQNLLSDWRIRAVAAGLIQEIESQDVDRLSQEEQGPSVQPQPPGVATRLMMALEEDCVELGLELSLEQLQRIERVVRDGVPSPHAAQVKIDGLPLIDHPHHPHGERQLTNAW
jgi:hypothetical protein